jgi:hypothetical protein
MKLESGDCGSHPDTRKAPRRGALGGGMLACLYQTDWCQALFTLFIEQYVTNLYESAMSMMMGDLWVDICMSRYRMVVVTTNCLHV